MRARPILVQTQADLATALFDIEHERGAVTYWITNNQVVVLFNRSDVPLLDSHLLRRGLTSTTILAKTIWEALCLKETHARIEVGFPEDDEDALVALFGHETIFCTVRRLQPQ